VHGRRDGSLSQVRISTIFFDDADRLLDQRMADPTVPEQVLDRTAKPYDRVTASGSLETVRGRTLWDADSFMTAFAEVRLFVGSRFSTCTNDRIV